jgi:hypothetical protein
MDWAAEKRALLVSAHAPFPGLGRLRLEDGRRKWENAETAETDA